MLLTAQCLAQRHIKYIDYNVNIWLLSQIQKLYVVSIIHYFFHYTVFYPDRFISKWEEKQDKSYLVHQKICT